MRHTVAARRALADQPGIVLDAEAWEQWEELNRRPARDLPRLREFMQRPAPVFKDGPGPRPSPSRNVVP